METSARPQTARLNVILPAELLGELRDRAARENTTVTELLRYAIGLEEYVASVREQGSKLFVIDPTGERTEILPRFTAGSRVAASAAGAATASRQTAVARA